MCPILSKWVATKQMVNASKKVFQFQCKNPLNVLYSPLCLACVLIYAYFSFLLSLLHRTYSKIISLNMLLHNTIGFFFLCLICSAHFFKALVNWGTQILLFTVKTISYLKLNLPWTSLYICWPTSSATLRNGVCVCGKTFLQVFTSTSLSYLRTFYGNWHFFTVRLETANAFPMLIHLLLEKTLFRLMLLQCPMNTDKRKTKKSNACSMQLSVFARVFVSICVYVRSKTWYSIVVSIDPICSVKCFCGSFTAPFTTVRWLNWSTFVKCICASSYTIRRSSNYRFPNRFRCNAAHFIHPFHSSECF